MCAKRPSAQRPATMSFWNTKRFMNRDTFVLLEEGNIKWLELLLYTQHDMGDDACNAI